MIEKTVLDFLAERLPVPVWMEIPPNPPERFVLLEKTGGRVEEGLGHATMAVQSYGKALWDVLQLNKAVKDAMEQLDAMDSICRVELNNDYHFSDPVMKRQRYQSVFDILYYED